MHENNNEKLMINVSGADLGKIDYLVEQGFYGNRTDFLCTAIKGQLCSHENRLNREFISKTIDVGIVSLNSENIHREGIQDYTVLGKLNIEQSVTLDQLKQAFRRIKVYGKVQCSSEMKEAYRL